jgi:radical SAM superfamily enzyme YgiQ (UPF0313 family)
MKVLLINSPYGKLEKIRKYKRVWPPLELVNISALLEKEGIESDIIDLNTNPLNFGTLRKISENYDKVFITSEGIDRWQCPKTDIKEFISISRMLSKGSEVYIMGPSVSSFPNKFLIETRARAAIIGEPELTVVEIATKNKIEDIDGIYTIRNGKILYKPRMTFLDLNNLPLLPYEKLTLKRYKYELMGDNFFLFESSRGCPYNCKFCAKNVMYGFGYRMKKADLVVRDIERAYELGIRNGYFIDLEFNVNTRENRKNVKKICKLLKEKRIDFKWACQTRVDSVDIEILKEMKKAGCDLIHFGIESGSERIMRLNGKGITRDQVIKAINSANKLGIRTVGFFMFGYIGEKLKDMIDTIDFASKLNLTYASFNIATPYPGSQFYEMVKDEIKNLEYYDKEVSIENIKRIISLAYRRFYFRPKSLKTLFLTPNILDSIELFLDFSREE